MKRFVIVATMTRGSVDPAEPLDDAGQQAAFGRLVQESEPGSRRLPIYSGNDSHVIWRDDATPAWSAYGSGENSRTVDDMMRLAAHRRTA